MYIYWILFKYTTSLKHKVQLFQQQYKGNVTAKSAPQRESVRRNWLQPQPRKRQSTAQQLARNSKGEKRNKSSIQSFHIAVASVLRTEDRLRKTNTNISTLDGLSSGKTGYLTLAISIKQEARITGSLEGTLLNSVIVFDSMGDVGCCNLRLQFTNRIPQ